MPKTTPYADTAGRSVLYYSRPAFGQDVGMPCLAATASGMCTSGRAMGWELSRLNRLRTALAVSPAVRPISVWE